jgi:hypothetical protein
MRRPAGSIARLEGPDDFVAGRLQPVAESTDLSRLADCVAALEDDETPAEPRHVELLLGLRPQHARNSSSSASLHQLALERTTSVESLLRLVRRRP